MSTVPPGCWTGAPAPLVNVRQITLTAPTAMTSALLYFRPRRIDVGDRRRVPSLRLKPREPRGGEVGEGLGGDRPSRHREPPSCPLAIAPWSHATTCRRMRFPRCFASHPPPLPPCLCPARCWPRSVLVRAARARHLERRSRCQQPLVPRRTGVNWSGTRPPPQRHRLPSSCSGTPAHADPDRVDNRDASLPLRSGRFTLAAPLSDRDAAHQQLGESPTITTVIHARRHHRGTQPAQSHLRRCNATGVAFKLSHRRRRKNLTLSRRSSGSAA